MAKLKSSMTMPERQSISRSAQRRGRSREPRSRSVSVSRRQSGGGVVGGEYQQFPEEAVNSGATRSNIIQPFDIEQHSIGSTSTGRSSKQKSSSFVSGLFNKQPSINEHDEQQQQQPSNSRSISQSFSTGKSTFTINPRPYKGFSSPFCGLFKTSGKLPPIADNNNDDDPIMHSQKRNDELQLSNLRTDLCSLPCYGILQSDYTRYLVTHTRPPSLCKRMTYHILIPLTVFLVAGWCAGNIRDAYTNSIVCTALVYCIVIWIISGCVRSRKKRVMVREEILWRLKRREEKIKKRMEERRERLTTMGRLGPLEVHVGGSEGTVNTTDTDDYEYYSEDEYEYQKRGYENTLGQGRFEMNCAHRMIGCYPSDIPRGGLSSPHGMNEGFSDEYILQQDNNCSDADDSNGDLCTRISSCCAKPIFGCVPCCNNSYGFHIQVCGLCGLAQEAREANVTLPRHLRMIDYITMEPFLLYYPRIVELRMMAVNSFWEHVRALSSLSKLLLVSFKVILVALLTISLVNSVWYWSPADMIVLVATFLQSFAVMYCVHWGWHRFDLSIDAVIKYFACGFLLSTGMAFTVELVEYLTFKLMVMGVILLLDVEEVQDNGYGGLGAGMRTMSDGTRLLQFFGGIDNNSHTEQHGRYLSAGSDILQGFFERQPAAKVFYILISSYVMAGLVEETCKYFGFVMLDHPDFCSVRELEKAKATMPLQLLRDRTDDEDDDEEEADGANNEKKKQQADVSTVASDTAAIAAFNPADQRRSLTSIRAGVTCAMVAVALGFTCCENILHIFIYNRSSLKSELATLIVKSLFPVHAIAAAIQSVYVCRRDLEKDISIGLGRIVLAAVMLHGTYDFALLMITSSWQRSHKEQYFNDGGNNVTIVAIVSFCVSLFIIGLGGLYYFFISRAQYKRLQGESSDVGSKNNILATGLLL